MILRPCVVLLRQLSQEDSIASKRETPCVEIHSCIRGFHVYKATVVFSSGVYFLYGPLSFVFVSTSSVTCLLQYKKRESV